jgi:hypothetical protein
MDPWSISLSRKILQRMRIVLITTDEDFWTSVAKSSQLLRFSEERRKIVNSHACSWRTHPSTVLTKHGSETTQQQLAVSLEQRDTVRKGWCESWGDPTPMEWTTSRPILVCHLALITQFEIIRCKSVDIRSKSTDELGFCWSLFTPDL